MEWHEGDERERREEKAREKWGMGKGKRHECDQEYQQKWRVKGKRK